MSDLKNVIDLAKEESFIKKENRFLKKRYEECLQQLEDLRKSKGLRLPTKKRGSLSKDSYVRLIVPDVHGSHCNENAVGAMLSDISDLNIRECVILGDFLECGGWLATSHTMGYVAQIDESDFEHDVNCANALLDKLESIAVDIDYLEGNHEHRIERWIVDVCKGNESNSSWLMRQIGPEKVLSLEDRGINYYKMDKHYNDLPISGTIKKGKTCFTHGFSTAKHAALETLLKFAGCVVYGHTHRRDEETLNFVNVGMVTSWCPGCLCELSPRWNHNKPTNWSHGYGLQIIDPKDDTFQYFNIPIFLGRSYLKDIAQVLNRS